MGIGKNDPTKPFGGDDNSWDFAPLPYNTTIHGTEFHDAPLNGGWDNDVIYGYAGRDEIYGYGGNDTIRGGLGNDKIYGGSGHDYLFGDEGNDTIVGGPGNDRIYGGAGDDFLFGGAGNDIFFFSAADQSARPDVIFDFEANDRIAIQYGHGTIPGTATNYIEYQFDGATMDQMKALADFAIADPRFQHVFITNGSDGFLYSGHGNAVETLVALWDVKTVDSFDWTNIV